ncbi:type II toxin-antitoxin system RelE/ParE family toxin [Neoroseomonas rubea]|uniref:type II toxin-antitoxin system RelE/ParE family toxin n=1 Tax=Neoroseomonas rubea TaxID=2748666 RepID=UPI0018E0639C|nr:type II toxin-antitoxin system RelE/ParE family toxin [Roseomonas rubea]
MQAVIETPDYLADADDAGMTAAERKTVVDTIAKNPDAGEMIVGTGGARKVRFARPSAGKGKSGGYRVITYFAGADVPVFLLNVFAKGDRVDLSQAERNALRDELAGLAADYRKGVRGRVKGR